MHLLRNPSSPHCASVCLISLTSSKVFNQKLTRLFFSSVAVQQWNNIFARGKAFNPPVIIALSSVFGYLSYRSYSTDGRVWGQYATAAVLLPAVVPFTLVVLNPTNDQLISAATVELSTETTRALLQKWGVLNALRSVFLFVGAGLGAWAALTEA
jgi:hypothetical protein